MNVAGFLGVCLDKTVLTTDYFCGVNNWKFGLNVSVGAVPHIASNSFYRKGSI